MTKPANNKLLIHLRASDAQAAAQLATQATLGVARITEGVHQSVWTSMGVAGGSEPGRTRGLTRQVYRSIEAITQLVGLGLEKAFRALQPLLESAASGPPNSARREAVLAALNGVMGDRLAAAKNPLATPMGLYFRGQLVDPSRPVTMEQAAPKLVLMIHGLCMNDLQWQTQHDNPDVYCANNWGGYAPNSRVVFIRAQAPIGVVTRLDRRWSRASHLRSAPRWPPLAANH